jgi:hypothetical protein
VRIRGTSPVFDQCVFDGNFNPFESTAIIFSSESRAVVTNSVFTNYDASIFCTDANITIVNCTFAKNDLVTVMADRQPFQLYPKATFNNCVLWGNTHVSNYNSDLPTLNYCINSDTTNVYLGAGNINADPLYVNVNDPDGPDNIWGTADDDLRLLCASPGINTGNNNSLPTGITLDFAGAPRIQQGTVDMGAYENATPAFTSLSTANDTARQFHTGTISYGVCGKLIATVSATGAAPLRGITVAKVWNEAVQPADYAKRHYEITPDSNAATATGRITLYFTQQEFTDYNAINMVKLPTGPTDAVGVANLVIEKRAGTSSNGSGLPATYPGAPVIINPADADIVWNSTAGRWEVSFDVTGFSGFFVKTQQVILPLQWLSIRGNLNSNKQAVITWNVQETNVATYEVERSTDGIQNTSIATLNSRGNGTNSYSHTDAAPLNGIVYYRVKQTGKDGQTGYSAIVRLQNNGAGAGSLVVYPNPFKTGFTISTTTSQTAQLLDAQGKGVMTIQLKSGTNYITATTLSAGMYWLRTEDGATQKLIKE